jgi:hypothetical protein
LGFQATPSIRAYRRKTEQFDRAQLVQNLLETLLALDFLDNRVD